MAAQNAALDRRILPEAMNRVRGVAGSSLVGALLLTGCQDPMQPLPPVVTPPAVTTPAVIGELRGVVDLASATMTFEPIRSPSPNYLFSAQVYGNQGETMRLYNNTVSVTTTSAGRKLFAANVGLQNLLPHAIGDEQGGAAPADTMGIFFFFTELPVVTSSTEPCGGCTITLPGTHGTAAFTAPNQHYFYWPEIVGARGGGADTTLTRVRLSFDADPRVLNFAFRVLIYAAWPAPHSSRWRVEYRGDSIPDAAGTKPRWRTAGLGGTWSSSAGTLKLDVLKSQERLFYRRDSIAPGQDAYLEGRAQSIRGQNAHNRNAMGFADGSRYVGIGFGANSVGWIDNTGSFLSAAACGCPANPVLVSTSGFKTYTLRKFGSDSAVVLLDGVRQSAIAYSQLDSDPFLTAPMHSPLVFFGMTADNKGNGGGTEWQFVRYELGAATP